MAAIDGARRKTRPPERKIGPCIPKKEARVKPQQGGAVTSQVLELLLAVCESLGLSNDREIASLVGVSPETVHNWRTGAVRELKPMKLAAAIEAIQSRIGALREKAGLAQADLTSGLTQLEVGPEASPSELQRQLRDRVHYDYLGHRFLYFEPQGALAWENLIRGGYEQDRWLRGAQDCARAWLDPGRNKDGSPKGPIAAALGIGRRGSRIRGLDVISLGPGDGGKELLILDAMAEIEAQAGADGLPPWRSLALVDVSVPLLMHAAMTTRRRVAQLPFERAMVQAFCSDFEEGPFDFVQRLASAHHEPDASRRLVLVLGNVFGNLRHEDAFVQQKLGKLVRPGDLLWLEVALRAESVSLDPVFRLTQPRGTETAAETNRRLLLEGPYRRWEAALGRSPTPLELRVWVREDDEASTIPGSYNFCHDLVLTTERRTLTMLYSRRYDLELLTRWFEQRGYAVERIESVADTKQVFRVAHLLLRRLE
jgi:uncharacterized SAM-dependent methyltransferase